MTATPVRLALIGLGGMGSAHLEIFTGLPRHRSLPLPTPTPPSPTAPPPKHPRRPSSMTRWTA